MKLYIWQQFASNHSNSFTVVGKFPSQEEAREGYRRLYEILMELYNSGYTWVTPDEYDEPTPTEKEIGECFGFVWNKHHPWVIYYDEDEPIKEYIEQFDDYLIIHSPEVWTGQSPFDHLMSKLGGEVSTWSEMGTTYISVDISCTVPDVQTGEHLYKLTEAYFTKERAWEPNDIPWVAYGHGKRHEQADIVIRIHKLEVEREMARQKVASLMRGSKHSPESLALQQKYIQDLENSLATLPKLTREEQLLAYNLGEIYIGVGDTTSISLAHRQLSLLDLHLSGRVERKIATLRAWLEDNGCTDFRYSIQQKPKIME